MFRDYSYQLNIRGNKEPILLTRIEAEALILKLMKTSERFLMVFDYSERERASILINTADIVSVIPGDGWFSKEEKKLTDREQAIHEEYLKVVEGFKFKQLN